MKNKIINALCWGVIFGIAVQSFVAVPALWWASVAGTLVVLAPLLLFWPSNSGVRFFCVLLGIILGVATLQSAQQSLAVSIPFGQSISFEGVVSAETTTNGRTAMVTIAPHGGAVRVRASIYTPIHAQVGDAVWVRGMLAAPENFSDFNYIGYLQRHGVVAIVKQPRVIVLRSGAFSMRRLLLQFKQQIVKRAQGVLNQESSSLVLGILIGYRQSMPDTVTEAFKKTGLSHIVAVSGSNMTILATALGALAWVVGRRTTGFVSMVILIAFTIITGATAAVVRAAIMVMVMLIAQLTGRVSYSVCALLITCAIMLIHNPLLLRYDIGFQLSVLATVGVLLAMQITSLFNKEGFWVSLLGPTFGAIITTAPIVAFHFGTLSIIAPMANALVLPSVPIVMALGFASLLPIVHHVAAPLTEMMIHAQLWVVQTLANVSWSSAEWKPHVAALVSYYIIVFVVIRLILKNRSVVPLKSSERCVTMNKIIM